MSEHGFISVDGFTFEFASPVDLPRCRVCGGPLTVGRSDYVNGTLAERDEKCDHCGLYEYAYAYGGVWERWGVVEDTWSYDGDRTPDWRPLVEEAKVLWNTPDAMCLVRAVRDRPADETPRLVLADWCEDHNLPLSCQYLRRTK